MYDAFSACVRSESFVHGVCYQVILARKSRLHVVVATMIAYNLTFQHPDVTILDSRHLHLALIRR